MSDFRMVSVNNGTSTISTIRQKVEDYLYYAIYQGERVNATDFGNCTAECGQGIFQQKCCAGITAWNGAKTQRDFWYACVNMSVAGADYSANIANYDVKIDCVQSGGKRLTAYVIGVIVSMVAIAA